MHGLAATGANRAFRLDDLLDARQVCRKRPPVGAALLRALAFKLFVLLFFFGLRLGAGGLQVFQR